MHIVNTKIAQKLFKKLYEKLWYDYLLLNYHILVNSLVSQRKRSNVNEMHIATIGTKN